MKRRWTRGEKWLWVAPLLLIVAGIAATIGPPMAHKAIGWPVAQLKADNSDRLYFLSLAGNGAVIGASGMKDPTSSRSTLGQLYFWDARTLQPLHRWDLSDKTGSAPGYASSFMLSPDGKRVAYAHWSAVGVYDLATQRPLWEQTGEFLLGAICFSPDGKVVGVSQGEKHHAKYVFYDAQTGKPIVSWKVHPSKSDEAYLTFSRDGALVATLSPRKQGPIQEYPGQLSDGRNIEIRRFPSGKLVRILAINWTKQFAFSPDGTSMVVLAEGVRPHGWGTQGDKIVLFSLATGAKIWSYGTGTTKQSPQTFLSAVAFAPDGKRVALYQRDRPAQVLLFDAQTGKVERTLKFHAEPSNMLRPEALVFTPDGKRLFARGMNEILVWDLD